jgi:hypothetical protein
MSLTAMDNIVLVQVIDRLQNLFNSLRTVLFGELALLANSVEQLSTSRELCDDVVFVLDAKVSASICAWFVLGVNGYPLLIRTSPQT